jgi:hypothetical protein
MTTFRVDITSGPLRDDGETVERIRGATAGLANLTVLRVGEGAIGVEFNVEANGLGDALELGERGLRRRLEEAGIEMSFFRGGSTGWMD